MNSLFLMIGAAYRSAELILLERIAIRSGQVILPAVSIELCVLQNLEQHAVDFVRARFETDVDDAARSAPILGVGAIGQ